MELNHFARIGKGVLSKAIGLQKNYSEQYSKGPDILNENKSGCHNCPIHQAKETLRSLGLENAADQIHSQCKACSTSIWEPSYISRVCYINEKNKYGYQPTLKCNAIKLLLLYHFLQPDAHGFIRNVDLKELAKTVGCSLPTIISCNQILQTYRYCFTCEGISEGLINIYLPEYKDYHKTAAEGGRGYITMSSDMMGRLLEMTSLNTLRLNLRGILDVDNASYNSAKKEPLAPVISSYQKLRRFLPRYCKRNVIVKALEQNDSIFLLDFQDKAVTFTIREEFAQKNIREHMVADTAKVLVNYVDSLNDVLEEASGTGFSEKKDDLGRILSNFNIEQAEKYPTLSLKLTDYTDLASLAVQYNIHLVKEALGSIYSQFICQNRPIDSIGALARTYIRRRSFFSNAS